LEVERLRRGLHAADEPAPFAVARTSRERSDVESQRVERLPQVVARRGEQLTLRAIGAFGSASCVVRRTGALAELGDQVDVLVAHGERLRQHVVQSMSEADDERQYNGHHEGREQMHRIADERDAHDQRHERRQHETIKCRSIDRGEIEPAHHHAEHADDQQRFVRRRSRIREPTREPPESARECRAERPIPSPSTRRNDSGTRAPPRSRESAPPALIGGDQCEPADHGTAGDVIPHDAAQDERTKTHRQRCQVPARIERRCPQRALERRLRSRERRVIMLPRSCLLDELASTV